MKIILNGAAGAMGQNVTAVAETGLCDAEIAAKVDRFYDGNAAANEFRALSDFHGPADVIIDFSHHSAAAELLSYAAERLLPVVICTTGHTEEEEELIRKASETVPVFHSANMSIGVAVLRNLVVEAAAALPDAEIEIIETHHTRKLDVPSGTALMLGNAIRGVRPEAVFNIGRHENGRRKKEEIDFHSLRYGNISGIHEVVISTEFETLTLKHETHDRRLFAEGALRAASWLLQKNAGFYDMGDFVKG